MQNKEAFTDLVKENEGMIYKISRVYSTDTEDQKDLYQEVVYQLWKSFGSFRGESRASTWVYRVVLNTCLSHSKKEKRRKHQTTDSFDLHHTPEDTVLEERIEMLYRQIAMLNVVEKGIILLFLEGKSYDEIAEISGFSVSNVGTRLSRIREKLKAQLTK